jgi:hypothetical protein
MGVFVCAALLGVAEGAETQAESTHDLWTSMKDLVVEPALVRPVEEVIELTSGPERLTLRGGWMVPVFSGRLVGRWEDDAARWMRSQTVEEVPRLPSDAERGTQQLVGWMWTGGEGRVVVPLPDRADALVLANRMVMDVGEDREAWAGVASGAEPVSADVDVAIVLAADEAIANLFLTEESPDPYEIVVYGDSDAARRAAARMQAVFADRWRMWDVWEVDRGERVAWDRIAMSNGVAPSFTSWDLLTDQRWGLLAQGVDGDDRWLSVVRDTVGLVDERREVRVSAIGIDLDQREMDLLIGGMLHPPRDAADPTSAPAARVRVEPVLAESTVLIQPTPNGVDLAVTVDSHLTFRAVGGPVIWIDLLVPKMDRVPDSFRLVKVELEDGTPLLGSPGEDVDKPAREAPEPRPKPPDPDPGPGPGPGPGPDPDPDHDLLPEPTASRVRLLLPVPLQPGEQVVVHLVHEDTWPLSQVSTGELRVSLGQSSGVQGFLPVVAPNGVGPAWPFRARVAVPMAGRVVAAVSGRTVSEGEQQGWRVTRVESEGRAAWFPAISAGLYTTVDDPAQLGFPAVRVKAYSTHYDTIDQFAAEIRRVIGFYQGWLPTFPVREVEVFEAPPTFNGFIWTAPHGMISLSMMYDTRAMGAPTVINRGGGGNPRNDRPHLENGIVAHEIAHHYWGHLAPPASSEDFWIAESFAELFSCIYLSAAFDAQDCEVRMAEKRRRWEGYTLNVRPGSLSQAYSSVTQPAIVYDYGAYVLGEMLIRRLGREPFFAAIDLMLREHPDEPLSSERLQAYLEAASGKDLDDFFDFWIHQGRVPALSLTWTTSGGTVRGTVESDVPFGTFDVPVHLRTKDATSVVWVAVVDGKGAFEAATPAGDSLRVDLDPEGYVLARQRSAVAQR